MPDIIIDHDKVTINATIIMRSSNDSPTTWLEFWERAVGAVDEVADAETESDKLEEELRTAEDTINERDLEIKRLEDKLIDIKILAEI